MNEFRQVTLVFDDDSKRSGAGIGVLPKLTLDPDTGFDPNWSGLMMFHDVFEHWFEHVDPYFKGEYAMNIGGEMCAMGACWYFYDLLRLDSRLSSRGIWSPQASNIGTTHALLQVVALHGDYSEFGNTLLSNVPPQKPADEEMEAVLNEYWLACQLDKAKAKTEHGKISDTQERQAAKRALRSITERKIRDLHRYGWHKAAQDFPATYPNMGAVQEFWQFWTDFCVKHPATDLYPNYREIDFRLFHINEEKTLRWTAEFISDDQRVQDNFTIDSDDLEAWSIPDTKYEE